MMFVGVCWEVEVEWIREHSGPAVRVAAVKAVVEGAAAVVVPVREGQADSVIVEQHVGAVV